MAPGVERAPGGANRVRAGVWLACGVLWVAGTAVGLTMLMNYDTRPGLAAAPPLVWPDDATIARSSSRPVILMLAHPQCDCTRASLDELAELVARAVRKPDVYVLFVRPAGVEAGWERSGGLWDRAGRITGARVLADEGGREAARFRVQTSGQTVLYDEHGRLVFTGGLTAARGKPGNSVGRTAVLAWLNGEAPVATDTSVFGCSLLGTAELPAANAGPHTHDTQTR
jgi:hypothetical protein